MKIKFIEQWKFRLTGKSVPVMKALDIELDGRIRTLQDIGSCKDRPNSLIQTWDSKGWEKSKEASQITFIDAKGNPEMRWVVTPQGETVNLYTWQRRIPDEEATLPEAQKKPLSAWQRVMAIIPMLEGLIGKSATLDDIEESMDLHKSMKYILIGLIFGVLIGWVLVAPIVNGLMK